MNSKIVWIESALNMRKKAWTMERFEDRMHTTRTLNASIELPSAHSLVSYVVLFALANIYTYQFINFILFACSIVSFSSTFYSRFLDFISLYYIDHIGDQQPQ